ncbi:SulP family inorganic anion transporter [Candidatus Marithioploca araucensis]|uniref:SulP family inorganic anion transporter n=1 Tax=Candidatus Marithioploca araucensis TaxID=70273 RepID=A0ABT7VQF5_9GAMM|nr:SulP family inorganic anion transporter [Candidatus Marithioploca araucensis]
MNQEISHANWWHKLFPFLLWFPMLDRETIKVDIVAGIVAGVLILPQAIALATLAGMPPEYGFYTAIFPVIIASLYGSSWHALSGPNTAMCVMMGSALGLYASESTPDYIMYAITLSFMVGVIQIVFGALKLGVVFNYFSHTVMVAIVTGVGIIIIVQQVGNFLGIIIDTSEPIEDTVVQIFYNFPRSNWYAVFVGSVTVISGLIVKRWFKKWPYLIVCVIVGMIVTKGLDIIFGSGTVNLDKLGTMVLSPLPLSAPDFSPENFAEAAEGLYTIAFVLAFLGLMQSCVIARAMAIKSGQNVNMNQEVIGQGLSNIGGSFLSCFPSCGSFNRSASNLETGAITPLAGVISAIALGLLMIFASPIVAEMPITVMAGVLFLVGAGLIKLQDIKKLLQIRGEARIIFLLTLGTTVYGGLDKGVFMAIFLSIVAYLRSTSSPELDLFVGEEAKHYIPNNLKGAATVLQISGNVFFGSVHTLERVLSDLSQTDNRQSHLVIDGEYLHHLDMAGAKILVQEAKKRQKNGYQLALLLRDHNLDDVLQRGGLINILGRENILYGSFGGGYCQNFRRSPT